MITLLMSVMIAWTSAVFAADEASIDQLLDLILNEQPTITTSQEWSTVTTPDTTGGTITSPNAITPSSVIDTDAEFIAALSWMYTKWLTKYPTTSWFEPTMVLTRQQAAKFFVVMQETILWKTTATTTTCSFSDKWFDETLLPFVEKACAYGIMQWKNAMFRPNDAITKPEFVTALVRMIEGGKLDETTNPRWLAYYQVARDNGLTKEKNANAFDIKITRYDAALLLYRAIGLFNATTQNTATTGVATTGVATTGAATTGAATTGIIISWNAVSWNDTVISDFLTTSISAFGTDPSLQEAIYRMNDRWMTRYTTIEDFRPFDVITRQEAAKIFTLFRQAIINTQPSEINTACNFTDIDVADETLAPSIQEACKLQILKWGNGKFEPLTTLTKPQAVAIIVRMLEGNVDETTNPRWQGYYNKAISLWLIQAVSVANFDRPITRYEVAMLLYTTKIKKEITDNLNNNYETNKLIFPIQHSLTTWSISTEKVWLVTVNTSILERSNKDVYVVDLFGNQYKIKKIATQKYLDADYVWYGKMMTLDETKEIGTTALTISNGVVIEGVFRPYKVATATYYLSPSETNQPYYNMTITLK